MASSFPQYLMEASSRAVDDIINCDFQHAFLLCDSLKKEFPTDPLPSILKLSAMGMRDIDCEKTIDSAGFINEFLVSQELIRSFEQKNGITSYGLMLDGLSKAMHAAFFLRQKAYFDVLHNGVDAIKLLKKAKELDSTNADADFFLGLYDYGKSELKKKLWMVLFWYPGSKKEGIEKLKNCSKNASLTRIAAKLSLSDIYIQEKKPGLSEAIISELENQYKNSRFVLWAKVKYLESVKNYDSTAAVYEKLSMQYALIPEGKQNFFATRNRMAHMLKLAGKNQSAAEVCKSLLDDQQFDQYREIKKDTRKLLENLDNGKS
ncbi:MAG: hypothetical protein GX267_18030 [Fibrobacter sp.]|jgi:hypothetical protein|nr:hypothetical protein [Fibrobacter sp.]